MTENNDKTPVAIAVSWDKTGFRAEAKSRLISAIDRLTGGLFEWPSTWVDERVRAARARSETRAALEIVDRSAAAELLQHHPDVGKRTLDVFLAEQSRKQANRDAIASQAMEELKALPPPAETGESAASREPDALDQDWMNVFSDHAEKASSEHLRTMWSRVLAGEIRKPGAFSLSTLRVIAELDREIAKAFEKYAAMRLLNSSDIPVAALRGADLSEATLLEDVGLVNGASGVIGFDVVPNKEKRSLHRNGPYQLHLYHKEEPGPLYLPSRQGLLILSRAGRQIADILPPPAADTPLRVIATCHRKEMVKAELEGPHGIEVLYENQTA